MDAVTFITKLQKFIKESYQNIGDAMISGTATSAALLPNPGFQLLV